MNLSANMHALCLAKMLFGKMSETDDNEIELISYIENKNYLLAKTANKMGSVSFFLHARLFIGLGSLTFKTVGFF